MKEHDAPSPQSFTHTSTNLVSTSVLLTHLDFQLADQADVEYHFLVNIGKTD